MLDMGMGDFWWTPDSVYELAHACGTRAGGTDYADKLLSVVPAGGEGRASGLAVEFPGTENIDILGGAVKPVLERCH